MPDLTDLADAATATDAILHAMAIAELAPLLDWAEDCEAQWAAQVRDALESSQIPERTITELKAEITQAQEKTADFRARIGNRMLDAADRAQAQLMASFYEQESVTLESKLTQAEAELESAMAVVNKCRGELDRAKQTAVLLALAIANPWNTEIGQDTQAYRHYLPTHLSEIILIGGESDPRFDSAVQMLETLSIAAGYNGPDLNKRESDLAKRMWDDYRDEQLSKVPTPSGADVMSAINESIERFGEDKNYRSYIEDRRGLRLPRNDSVDLAGRPELRWSR